MAGDVLAPEPVFLPDLDHLLDGDVLRLRQEEVDERCHHHHPSPEEVEQPEFQVAQQSQEDLTTKVSLDEREINRTILR